MFGFLKKKKEVVQENNLVLEKELLAEAITIYCEEIDLLKLKSEYWRSGEKKQRPYCSPKEKIHLNEHLFIKIDYLSYTYDNSLIGLKYLIMNEFEMFLSIYVDDIHLSNYMFELDLKENSDIYRPWECLRENIIHDIPKQFIVLMNDWSRKVVNEFEEKRQEMELLRKEEEKDSFLKEEEKLKKYM